MSEEVKGGMTSTRARELFSDYRDGSLQGHLREAFESALAGDPALRREYEAIDRALMALEAMRDEPVPEPYLMHERIVSRVDKAILQRTRSRASWLSGWRLGLVGAVGAAAILAAFVNMRQDSDVSMASIGPAPAKAALSWSVEAKGVRLNARASEGKLAIRDEDGVEVYSADVPGSGIELPLANLDAGAKLYVVVLDKRELRIALPGRKAGAPDEGEGTVDELALATAARFERPVEVRSAAAGDIKWTFDTDGPAATRVSRNTVSVQELEDGRIVID
jgi:hypothetical protein